MQNHRRIVTLLRWVMFLALAYLTLSVGESISAWQSGLLVVVVVSNIVLARLPAALWEHPILLPLVALLDVGILVAIMLRGQGFERDFFFAYFLLLAVVALGNGLRLSALGAALVVAAYGVYLGLPIGMAIFQDVDLLGRLGFLFSVGVSYAGLLATSRARLRESALQDQLAVWVERLSIAFSDDFDVVDVIREVLVDIQRVHPGSTRVSLVQVQGDAVRVIASGDDREIRERVLSAERYPELQQVIRTREPVVINDIRTSKVTESVRERVGNLPFTSLLLHPVDLEDESIGHVVLRIARKRGAFTPAMVGTTEHLAKAIGVIFRQGKLREALERSQKMAMVSQVTNSVAHSFNGILSTVLLSSEHMRKQAALHKQASGCGTSPCDDSSMQRFESIELAIKEGLTIVERLNAWTRLRQEAAGDDVSLTLVDPEELLREAWSYAQPQWVRCGATRDLELAWNVHPAPLIEGNRAELREVLLNLIVNAIDAMPRGGTLTLGVEGGQQGVRFAIEDTGVGIPADDLERIFEPVFSTKGAAGTGLGLSVARSVVQRHDGEIAVHSEEGVGTRFTLSLPPSEEPAATDGRGAQPQEVEPSGGRYLLVEGNELVRDVMVRFLQSTGFDVDVVASNEEAEVMLGTMRNYSAVLADAGAAVDDTAELVAALAKTRPDLRHRLLFYSTHAPNERFRELQHEHGFHFVDRSAGLNALRAAVTVAAGGSADPSQEAA